MIGNDLWSKGARCKLLHILPQAIYHGDAQIRGSNSALKRLGDALIEASKTGQGAKTEVAMMASDGEGYRVVIYPMSDRQMDTGPLPYSTPGLPWEHEACHDCPHKKEPTP